MNQYLTPSEYIDWKDPEVLAQAKALSKGIFDSEEITRRCFEFVRDEIRRRWDCKFNPVTCMTSDVLKYRTGYCYAKSHLLAVLLRANKIPASLCYQRLTSRCDLTQWFFLLLVGYQEELVVRLNQYFF